MNRALARRTGQHNLTGRAREAALANMLAEVAAEDVCVLRAAARAAELDSAEQADALLKLPKDELERQGWTREELRIARDARSSAKDVAFYLRMTHERTIMRYRGQDGAPPVVEAKVVLPEEPSEPAPQPALEAKVDETDR